MNEGLKILQLSVFEIISYFFPGVIFLSLIIALIPSVGFGVVSENLIAFIFVSYLLGNIIHSLSDIPSKVLWNIYHRFKEKDSDGHGLNIPRKFIGKAIHKMRYILLDKGIEENLSNIANSKIKERLKGQKFVNMDISQIKEMSLITNNKASGYFEYLNYQKVFSKSISFIFLIYSITTILIAIFGDYSINLPYGKIDFPYLAFIVFLISVSLSIVFNSRFLFFKQYREAILNSNIILNFDSAKDD